ncbi:DUF4065 domain-containing protein [Acinetobacter radioresistens]|uniref:Panacea domain-containing protein n=1 Tax=Acinetobacter radioresistens TaxID=40216 RepID=UPI0020032C78|nr:type II toxin-antitoxin system antitoxin SocA domain-containing protein [Acinetobacter radioresistens]MCK4089659.1 DUF4065 domain-containing protein [Acinetobacter radioresistens]
MNNYTAMDIANYIIWFSKQKFNEGVTNLKLQKLLYFVYGYHLAERDQKLFNDSIEKWQYGPVVPSVYHAFKDYGVYEIHQPKSRYRIDMSSGKPVLYAEQFEPEIISNDYQTKRIIEKYVSELIKKPAYELVEETHQHPMWLNFKDKILKGEKHLQYTDEEIKNFFKNNLTPVFD